MADMEYVKYAKLDDTELNRAKGQEFVFTAKLLKLLLILFFIISFTIIFKECFIPRVNDATVEERIHIIILDDRGSDKPLEPTENSTEDDNGAPKIGPCKPGSMKRESCNTCTCTDKKFWACTRMFCTGRIPRILTKPKEENAEN